MPISEAKLILSGFEVLANIGVHAHEKNGPQRLLIDIELTLANAARPSEDDISEVLNYDFLREETHKLLAAKHYELQESLAHDIAEFCLAHRQVTAVTVHTRKPDIYPDCQSIGYRLYASR